MFEFVLLLAFTIVLGLIVILVFYPIFQSLLGSSVSVINVLDNSLFQIRIERVFYFFH